MGRWRTLISDGDASGPTGSDRSSFCRVRSAGVGANGSDIASLEVDIVSDVRRGWTIERTLRP